MTVAEKPCRGIIVLDANLLKELAIPLPEGLIAKNSPITDLPQPTGSYLDLLPLLAKRGYRIILPEMVMYEVGQTLRNGTDMQSYFPQSGKGYEGCGYIKNFCSKVTRGRGYDGIEVAPAEGGGHYASYLRKVHDINEMTSLADIPLNVLRPSALMNLHKQYPITGLGYGEDHALDVISKEMKRQRKSGDSTPIFFGSSDSGARQRLQSMVEKSGYKGRVATVSSEGMLLGLGMDQVRHDGGMTSGLNELGLLQTAREHFRPKQHVSSVPDSLLVFEGGEVEVKYPFAQSLKGLGEELLAERLEKEKDMAAAPAAPSPLDRFKAKYQRGSNGYGPKR